MGSNRNLLLARWQPTARLPREQGHRTLDRVANSRHSVGHDNEILNPRSATPHTSPVMREECWIA